MKGFKWLKLVIVVLLSILTPALATAETDMAAGQDATILGTNDGPRVMLEKSQSYALDNYVRAFRTPIMDKSGNIEYWDVTITLTVKSDNKLKPTAKVTATKSPEIIDGALVPGTYVAPDGATCKVTRITLSNGRIQSFVSCKDRSDQEFSVSVATGTLTDGHPFLKELITNKIDQRSDAEAFTWGLLTSAPYTFDIGSCHPVSLEGEPSAAHTDGNVLILSFFNNDSFICSGTLNKQLE